MGETEKIRKLKETKVSVDDVLKTMDEEDKAAEAGKVLPTYYTASAIGITVPTRDQKPIDEDTGLPKSKDPPLEGVKEEKIDPVALQAKQMLRRRKAEARAAVFNKNVDASIQRMKEENFQRSTITSVIAEEHTE